MKKGKSRIRPARRDFLKSDARLERKRLRTTAQARRHRPEKSVSNYDKQSYDGNASEET
jgi:hypothetical protein